MNSGYLKYQNNSLGYCYYHIKVFVTFFYIPIPVLKHFSAYIVYVYRLMNVRDMSMLFFWFKLLQFPFTNARTRRLHNVCVYRTFTFHSPLVCRSRIVPGFFIFLIRYSKLKRSIFVCSRAVIQTSSSFLLSHEIFG